MTKLDDLLSKWPMPASTQLEADETAERVVAAIQAGQLPASVDDSILNSPLPKTADDEQNSRLGRATGAGVESKMSKDRTRERTSFQELAKMATTPPPPVSSGSATSSGPTRASSIPTPPPASISGSTGVVRGDEASSTDSGIVDLKAIASADPSGQQRAQSTPLASSGLFEDESAPPKPAVSPEVAERAVSAPPSAPAAPASAVPQSLPSAKQAVAEKKSGGGVVIAIGGVVAAAAIAAGVFFFVKHQHTQAASAQGASMAEATATVAANTPKAPTTAANGAVAQADTTLDLTDNTPDPQTGTARPRYNFHVKPGAGGGGVAPATTESASAPTVDPKLIANIPTGPAGGGTGDLNEAMKTAAGGAAVNTTNAAANNGPQFAPGSVAQRPSQGQVAGAIGTVMPAAKACLQSDEPTSHATVTFQSDGSVKSVHVTGFAAGKPQEACIKTALSKAKVDPFAESTYPVPVTIRSN